MHDHAPGLTLLEVVVALAILAVATLGIATVFDAATRRARAAEAARRALGLAAGAAETAGGGAAVVEEPEGSGAWRRVDDDGGPPCWIRTARAEGTDGSWLWIEATCGPEAPDGAGAGSGAEATAEQGRWWAGGRLSRSVVLVLSP